MYLWDSNILRHFAENHPRLQAYITQVDWTQIALPSVVVAELLRGRCEFALKATAMQAPQAHHLLLETRQMVNSFRIVPFDESCANALTELQRQLSTKKRYADVMIAATAVAHQLIVVTRNQKHFADLLPHTQLANWIDL